MFTKSKWLLIGIALGGVALYAAYMYVYGKGVSDTEERFFSAPVKSDTVITIKVDTLRFESIVYRRLPGRVDTVQIESNKIQRAAIDTVVGNNKDTISIAYYFPPINSFDIDIRLRPRLRDVEYRTITNTKYVPAEQEHLSLFVRGGISGYWSNPYFSANAGLAEGGLHLRFGHVKISPTFGMAFQNRRTYPVHSLWLEISTE